MNKKRPTGSFVALITPFNKDGSVDFAAFASLLEFQQAHGTSAVLIMGSTGETSMLSPEERKKIVVETARYGRVVALEQVEQPEPGYNLARVVHCLDRTSRYSTATSRALYRAVEELERVQETRKAREASASATDGEAAPPSAILLWQPYGLPSSADSWVTCCRPIQSRLC